jgi:hypothetical protein
MLNTWLTNGDEALQRVWGLVSIDGVAEEWTVPGSRLLGPRRSIADWFSFQMGTIEGWLPVEAQSKELPGVAILKLSPVFARSFSFAYWP